MASSRRAQPRCGTYIHFGSVGATSSRPDFRGDVDSSANAPCHVACVRVRGSLVDSKLPAGGEPKVADFHILDAIWAGADEDVLRLEISVNDVEAVDMSQALKHLAE